MTGIEGVGIGFGLFVEVADVSASLKMFVFNKGCADDVVDVVDGSCEDDAEEMKKGEISCMGRAEGIVEDTVGRRLFTDEEGLMDTVMTRGSDVACDDDGDGESVTPDLDFSLKVAGEVLIGTVSLAASTL